MNKSKYTYFDIKKLKVGDYIFTLKNVKEQMGHDDSLPYSATLYINDKKVATIFNDGWGGESCYDTIYNADLLTKAQNDVKDLPYPSNPYDNGSIISHCDLKVRSIANIADIIAYNILSFQKFYKKQKTHLIAINPKKGIIITRQIVAKNDTSDNFDFCEAICNMQVKDGFYILSAPHILP